MPTGLVCLKYGDYEISMGSGVMYASTGRMYFSALAYISIDNFEKLVVSANANYYCNIYMYDSLFNYLGYVSSTSDVKTIVKETILAKSSNAVYFSIEINKTSVSGYGTKTIEECLKESQIKVYGSCEIVERTS